MWHFFIYIAPLLPPSPMQFFIRAASITNVGADLNTTPAPHVVGGRNQGWITRQMDSYDLAMKRWRSENVTLWVTSSLVLIRRKSTRASGHQCMHELCAWVCVWFVVEVYRYITLSALLLCSAVLRHCNDMSVVSRGSLSSLDRDKRRNLLLRLKHWSDSFERNKLLA